MGSRRWLAILYLKQRLGLHHKRMPIHTRKGMEARAYLDALDLLLGPYQLPLQVLHLVLDVLLLLKLYVCVRLGMVGVGGLVREGRSVGRLGDVCVWIR